MKTIIIILICFVLSSACLAKEGDYVNDTPTVIPEATITKPTSIIFQIEYKKGMEVTLLVHTIQGHRSGVGNTGPFVPHPGTEETASISKENLDTFLLRLKNNPNNRSFLSMINRKMLPLIRAGTEE